MLRDRITTESTLAVLKAEAQGLLLGRNYRKWDRNGCNFDGWTPFGPVRAAIERKTRTFDAKIHTQQIISSSTLEQLTKCKFHFNGRKTATQLHARGKLLPNNPDISIWTDGSLQRDQLAPIKEQVISGAAAYVHVSDTDPHSIIPE